MNDKPKIFVGLAIALVLLTFPYWYALARGDYEARPELVMPDGGQTECVMETDWMRAHHMDLLNEWRDAVIRDGDTTVVDSVNGQTKGIPKSLTHGCMSCHTQKAGFCESCHNYANVKPTCWDCHVEPQGS